MDIQLREQLLNSSEKIHNRTRYYGSANTLDIVALQMIYELLADCALTIKHTCKLKLQDIANNLIIKNPDICQIRNDNVFFQQNVNKLMILVSDNENPTVSNNTQYFGDTETGDGGDEIRDNPVYTFQYGDFTKDFTPGTPQLVRIITLPPTGTIRYNGTAISAGFIFDLVNIANLKYTRENNAYQAPFLFQTSNNKTTNKLFSNMATFTLNVDGQVNQSATIGDGSITTAYNTAVTFTRAMFTSATTPPYSDPEGDAAATLRIDSLPATGEIRNNGVAVSVNDQIDFTSVIDAGLLTYHPDAAQTGAHAPDFAFSIADAGSGIFVS